MKSRSSLETIADLVFGSTELTEKTEKDEHGGTRYGDARRRLQTVMPRDALRRPKAGVRPSRVIRRPDQTVFSVRFRYLRSSVLIPFRSLRTLRALRVPEGPARHGQARSLEQMFPRGRLGRH